jgi:peptidoglycan/LPS O-acetylase OafA/YrhL
VNDALITAFTWETGHLWFILYLFVFCLLTLPLLQSTRSGRLRAPSERMAGFCEQRSWSIYLFAIPIMIAYIFMINLDDTFSRLFLVIPFVLGFLFYSAPASAGRSTGSSAGHSSSLW